MTCLRTVCHYCCGFGHLQADCPERQLMWAHGHRVWESMCCAFLVAMARNVIIASTAHILVVRSKVREGDGEALLQIFRNALMNLRLTKQRIDKSWF
ncbi:hypothetical protein VTN77DRAFT_5032 [Rasamsonia byssochlamydoides]|uniref:uncharacterized protein n=1 Tax=Rasamsonia byssochlamydoides TaxID=89139 RepID=UPI003743825D